MFFMEQSGVDAAGRPEETDLGGGEVLTCSLKVVKQCRKDVRGHLAIPEGVTAIGKGAFAGCTGLSSVTIPASVTAIGEEAFLGCASLERVAIPAGVTTIGKHAFRECLALTSFTVDEGNSVFFAHDGVLYQRGDSVRLSVVPKSLSGSVEIPEGITSLPWYAFEKCTGLTAFTVAEGNTAFFAQDGILYQKGMFNTVFAVPRGISGSVTIPAHVSSLSSVAFAGSAELTAIEVAKDNPNYASRDGVLFDKEGIILVCCPIGRVGEYAVPAGVRIIGAGAFSGCAGLTAVTLPEGLVSIGAAAFFGCSSLSGLTLPESLGSIGDRAFTCCTGLESFAIPAGVNNIGKYAFGECVRLRAFTVAAGNGAFFARDGVLYRRGEPEIILAVPRAIAGPITLPAGVTSVGKYTFGKRPGLTGFEVESGNSVFFAREGVLYQRGEPETVVAVPEALAGTVSVSEETSGVGEKAFYGSRTLSVSASGGGGRGSHNRGRASFPKDKAAALGGSAARFLPALR